MMIPEPTNRKVMKNVFLLFLFVCLAAFAGQAQQVSGLVRDAEGKPLNGVTVSLLRDTVVVKLAVTRENGAYSFTGIPDGRYRIAASYVGFSTARSEAFAVATSQNTEVPALSLVRAAGAELKGVTVVARKPIVEVKADKMIVNVEGTINATGNDALELLRKSPGVLVDKDENLSVSGKNGVQVYIDGRPSPLAGQDLSQYLRTLQAAQIEAIEIITNPSAKYEAAGNAGIINIRLKKNKNFGTNGSATAGYNIGTFAKYNTGINLNHRNNRINAYGSLNYNYSRNDMRMDLIRSVGDTLFDGRSRNISDNRAASFKAGLDFTLNKQSSLGLLVNGNFADPSVEMSSRTPIIHRSTGAISRILAAENRSVLERDNVTTNLNYNYNGKDGRSLVLNADYGWYSINTNQLQPNSYFSANGNKLFSADYRMISPTRIDISSVKADYEQNLAKGKLGLGGKVSNTITDNDFRRYDVTSSGEFLDRDRSNRFRYEEQIYAGYANYNRAWKGLVLQAGLRVEHTSLTGTSTGEKQNGTGYASVRDVFRRSYTDFFPSGALTFNKNPMKVWNLTFSRRIDRPAYQDLNPFEFKLDEYTFQRGNTRLRPQYTNSVGLSHTYKYKLNASVNYSHVQDIFTQLIDTTDRSKSFISRQNLAKQNVIAVNLSYPFVYKTFTSFVNINSNYSNYKADFGAGRNVNLDAFAFTFMSQNSLKFGKNKTWTGELMAFYAAPTIYQGAFRARSMWAADLGVQKQVLKGQGTVRAAVSDIFRTLRFRGVTDFAGQRTDVVSIWESRQFKLNFSWRFGNKQVKAAKQRSSASEEESKRTQGGGGIGVGQ